ncbi:MAG: hypothetical protein K0Q59_3434 [Paenibacillus sp.]|nr:hypothetical protein [Paenibacillus sp.]
MLKRSERVWAVLLLGAIVLGSWLTYTGTKRNAEDANAGLEKMLALADRLYSSPYAVVLQHSGPYRTAADDTAFVAMGDGLADALALPKEQLTRDAGGHRLYSTTSTPQSSAVPEDGRMTVALSGWEDGMTNVTLRWEAPANLDRTKLALWAEEQIDRLSPTGLQPDWSVTTEGYIGLMSADAVQELRQKISSVYKATVVDSYTDAGSEIVSYLSPLLKQRVRSGSGTVNLQSALRRDSVYGTYRLTLGTPLIASGL